MAATDVLTGAAGVELADLSVDDLADYLPRTARPDLGAGGGRWDPVAVRLRAHAAGADDPPTAVLHEVLATPLMVFLARTVYSDTPDTNPADLLDPTRYPDVDTIERHLLAAFVPAVYRRRPSPAGRNWQTDRAQAWLAFLARHLHRLGTRDLAWWRLRNSVPLPVRVLTFGLPIGLTYGLAVGLAGGLAGGLAYGLAVGLAGGLQVGLLFGLATTAWGQWLVLTRLWLPATGGLPWRVMGFLDDAYRRGVLRQVGAVYQFRHARLQDHLADDRHVAS